MEITWAGISSILKKELTLDGFSSALKKEFTVIPRFPKCSGSALLLTLITLFAAFIRGWPPLDPIRPPGSPILAVCLRQGWGFLLSLFEFRVSTFWLDPGCIIFPSADM